MRLKLTRPIVFFDLETTGTNITHDRIVQIAAIKVMPDGQEEVKNKLINPQMPIPAEATAVHKITDSDVADKPTFKQFAASIAEFFEGCDIAGFNSNRFDIPLLDQEFQRAGVAFDISKARFIDVQTIYHKKEPRNLGAAYLFYCDKVLEEGVAHNALGDTRATLEVFKAQLDKYQDLPDDVDALSEFASQNRNVDLAGRLIYDDQHREVINFGKYKGKLAAEVLRNDRGYYGWIMNGDFPQNTKNAFTRIMLKIK